MQNTTKVNGKTTPTINLEEYTRLLVKYQPKVIETEAENEQLTAWAIELEHQESRTQAEEAILELFITLITKFEEEHYPIPASQPQTILLHLIEANDISQEDLVGVLGSPEVVAEVVSGERSISRVQAGALASFFDVDVSLFI